MYKKGEEMSKEEAVQLLTAAGYNSSFGIKESKGEEKNVRDEESAET